MKKLFLILPVILLAACEQPTVVQMVCADWSVKAKIYTSRAILDIKRLYHNIEDKNEWMSAERGHRVVAKRECSHNWDENVVMFAGHDRKSKQRAVFLGLYTSQVTGFTTLALGSSEVQGYECRVIVPFKKGPPADAVRLSKRKTKQIKNCIDYIVDNAMVSIIWSADEPQRIVFNVRINDYIWVELDQETALGLSTNWDFNDMKFYNNLDEHVYAHQVDACEVMERIKDFQKNINKE